MGQFCQAPKAEASRVTTDRKNWLKTSHMVAVSDTSPISNLALIDRLDLLRIQFDQVWIPDAVKSELGRVPRRDARTSIEKAAQDGWVGCRSAGNTRLVTALTNELDRGEAEAIALATEIPADILLIDEKDGRVLARQFQLPVRRVLGILIRAKATGSVSSLRSEIEALRRRARFFVAATLEHEVLRTVGE
jgi:predicted nucleic acid-binding protein